MAREKGEHTISRSKDSRGVKSGGPVRSSVRKRMLSGVTNLAPACQGSFLIRRQPSQQLQPKTRAERPDWSGEKQGRFTVFRSPGCECEAPPRYGYAHSTPPHHVVDINEEARKSGKEDILIQQQADRLLHRCNPKQSSPCPWGLIPEFFTHWRAALSDSV